MITGTRLGLCSLFAGVLCGVSAAAPEPEAPTKAEVAGLTALHRQAVMHFIDRNGFGFSRMMPQITDILGPPKSGGDTPRAVVEDPMAIRAGTGGKDAHFSLAKAVGKATLVPSAVKGKNWVLKDVHLVGLVKHREPVVYLTGGAAMLQGKDVKTRRPDAFEARALEVIQGGGDLVQPEKTGEVLRAVSGIYAGRQCSKCHERPGEMLGAFSYRMALESPVPGAGGFGQDLSIFGAPPGLPFRP
ncbi:MAG TPA: hypothetical protein VD866_16235 [Urbifossiella sp.]|nr:hypothetical protein [Urbifossiella sp.]